MAFLIYSLRRAFKIARCGIITVPWLMHLLVADMALSGLLPLSVLAPTWTYHLSSAIAQSVWHAIQLIFTRTNHANITVSGTEQLRFGESAIVVSNHVGWTDFYMIQELALQCGMLGRCRWFAKRQLKWVPFLGWGLWAMGMPLVSRKWTADQREMDRVFHGILKRQWPVWLISFSEATRYTASKRQEAERWCEANNRSLGQHLLYPRTKGFTACVQKLRQAPHVKAVYDVTIAYANRDEILQSPPTFWQTLSTPDLNRDWRFYVHVDRFDLEQLPSQEDELAKWLEQRWVQKGERLERLQACLSQRLPWRKDESASKMSANMPDSRGT